MMDLFAYVLRKKLNDLMMPLHFLYKEEASAFKTFPIKTLKMGSSPLK